MDREELLKLHAALGALLSLPDSIRELLAQWLEASKPNRRDPHPLHDPSSPQAMKEVVKARAARRAKPTSPKTAERKLIAAMADNPGLSVVALANAAGSSRSGTGERLRQMAARGVVEKDFTGRWKLKAAKSPPPPNGDAPGPPQPSPN